MEILSWGLPIILSVGGSVLSVYIFMVRKSDVQEYKLQTLEKRVKDIEDNKISEALIKIDMKLKIIDEKLEKIEKYNERTDH